MTERKHLYGRKMERRPLPEKSPDEVTLQSIPSHRQNARCAVVRGVPANGSYGDNFRAWFVTLPKEPWEASK